MKDSTGAGPAAYSAPPTKRATPTGVPVRLHDGTLIAHVDHELADRLVTNGDALSYRSGSRRYLRLRQGIRVPRTDRGWGIIEFLRRWHGDKRAAEYVANKDQQSEYLRHKAPTRLTASQKRRP